MKKEEVSFREFARIIGVDHSVVCRAVKRGRLSKSVVGEGERKKVVIYDGCLEWRDNKDHSKDRGNGVRAKTDLPDDIMPIEMSVAIEKHFSALTKQLEYLKEAGDLISIDKFRTEAFQAARTTRDAILYVPVATSDEFKGVLKRLLSKFISPEVLEAAHKDIEATVGEYRLTLKNALTNSLHAIAESLTDDNESGFYTN
jgi:hypothetical protein